MKRSLRNMWSLDFMRKLVFSRAAGLSLTFLSSHFCMKHTALDQGSVALTQTYVIMNPSVNELVKDCSFKAFAELLN